MRPETQQSNVMNVKGKGPVDVHECDRIWKVEPRNCVSSDSAPYLGTELQSGARISATYIRAGKPMIRE